jgi:endonuclease III-like uncharacterized protein
LQNEAFARIVTPVDRRTNIRFARRNRSSYHARGCPTLENACIMPQSALPAAAELLRQHYGQPPQPLPRGEWLTLVRVVLERGGSAKRGRDWSRLGETPLATPEETARLGASRLEEILAGAGLARSHAGALSALAQWWLNRIGNGEALATFAQRPLSAWQEELRAIRGVSWEMADRILVVVGGLAIYPLDRGSLRIAARHGWMDMAAEYDDWQAFFIGGLRDTVIVPADLSFWNIRAGREFCGKQPKCNACPLKALLPERGPVPLELDE